MALTGCAPTTGRIPGGGHMFISGSASATIGPLQALTMEDLHRVASGYLSAEQYRVRLREAESGGWRIALELAALHPPKVKRFAHDTSTLRRLNAVIAGGTSIGAWGGGLLVGIAITERMAWNRNLVLWEFHVADSHRRRGVGRAMMEQVFAVARASDVRSVTAETQNTNVPAVHFYRNCGFVLQGVDLSLYADDHLGEDREVALFMRWFA